MPRIRTLKPEALQHRKVGRLSDRAFRLWIGLVTQADDHGRMAFDAAQYRLLVWGYHPGVDAKEVAAALDELRAFGLCRLYGDGDSLYVDLPSWHDHQAIQKEKPSKLPPYQPNLHVSGSTPVSLQYGYGTSTVGSEGSEGSEGRIWTAGTVPESAAGPARLGGAPAAETGSDQRPMQEPTAGPLAPELAQFMATVRAAARQAPGPVPRRGGDEAV